MQARPKPRKYRQKLARRQEQIPGKHNLELRPYQVLIRPLVTEKGTHQSDRYSAYTFQVHLHATKDQIKAAVQELFDVKVDKVRTITRKGKSRRFKMTIGTTPSWKKAIITLSGDDKIEFF